MSEQFNPNPEQSTDLPGSTPDQALLLSGDELSKLHAEDFEEVNARLITAGGKLPDGRVYIETEEPQSFKYEDGTEVAYNIWAVVTNPYDFGTRVDDMGSYLREQPGEEPVEVTFK